MNNSTEAIKILHIGMNVSTVLSCDDQIIYCLDRRRSERTRYGEKSMLHAKKELTPEDNNRLAAAQEKRERKLKRNLELAKWKA